MRIGLIGNGFVGQATKILKCPEVSFLVYDIRPEMCEPKGTTLEEICWLCDIIFISVPTPMRKDGSCCLDIVESVVENISKFLDFNKAFVVLRSTVPVGTSQRLNCYFMPEFLTERNFKEDFRNNEKWIFGTKNTEQDVGFKNRITQLITYAHNSNKITHNAMYFMSNAEAEMVKMFRNTYLATKVSFCNEVYQFCKHKDIEYEAVRKIAASDKRIGFSHTRVPGPDGHFGYGGTCFPKDTNSFLYEMQKEKLPSYILKAVVERNEQLDRKEKDWCDDTGRAVV